jgi:hypothetical protein
MKLVNEDKDGAYSGVTKEFLKNFRLKESNPNFDVYDSKDSNNRVIFTWCSRLPDDNDLNAGRYGINFHRAKPDYDEAVSYKDGLTQASDNRHVLNDMAFVASNRNEYDKKAAAWDLFYSFIWGKEPLTIFVTPHSGKIKRPPDDLFPWPTLEMDAYVSGAAAACALKNSASRQRTMMSIHSYNWLGAALDVGGFGIIDKSRLDNAAQKIEAKFHDKIQFLAGECINRFSFVALRWLNHILDTKKTLNPEKLINKSAVDRVAVNNIIKSLNLYGRKIEEFTLAEFEASIKSLKDTALQVISCNYIYSGEHVGELIKIKDKIDGGLMDSAVQIECSKLCLEKAPELISDIILDIKRELFEG